MEFSGTKSDITISLVLSCAEYRRCLPPRPTDFPANPSLGVKITAGILFKHAMKRIAALALLTASCAVWSIPAFAQHENRSIGENGREAKKASKQYRKAQNKAFKKQRKAMKKNQKAQRKLAKRQQHHK
ncbi:MAG: hypothetical protein WAM78_07550 [Candidatus Sulfotelmatobacter sp.]